MAEHIVWHEGRTIARIYDITSKKRKKELATARMRAPYVRSSLDLSPYRQSLANGGDNIPLLDSIEGTKGSDRTAVQLKADLEAALASQPVAKQASLPLKVEEPVLAGDDDLPWDD